MNPLTRQQKARQPRRKLSDFTADDQVRVHGFALPTGATLTVDVVQRSEGGEGVRVSALDGSTAFVRPDRLSLLTPVHPWVTLAARFPDAVRLRADPQGGQLLQARRGSVALLRARTMPPRAARWVTVGVIPARDGEGEAVFSEAGGAVLETALMRVALAAGWDVTRVAARTGQVRVTVRFPAPSGVDHHARGSGDSAALALSRAFRLVSEDLMGISTWPLAFSEAEEEEAWWQEHEDDTRREVEYFRQEREGWDAQPVDVPPDDVHPSGSQPGDQVRAPASSPLAGGVLTVDHISTCVGGTGLDVHALSTPTSFVAPEDVPLLTRVFPWVKLASVMPDALRLTPDGLGGTRLEVREGQLSHRSPKC